MHQKEHFAHFCSIYIDLQLPDCIFYFQSKAFFKKEKQICENVFVHFRKNLGILRNATATAGYGSPFSLLLQCFWEGGGRMKQRFP